MIDDKKIDKTIAYIRKVANTHRFVLAYSGGKDSEVLRKLCQLAKVDVDIVHNVTTIDPPGTIRYCEKRGAILNRSKYTFFELVAKKGLPNQWRRFCCQYLKEQYLGKYVFMGVRQAESYKRAERYSNISSCRVYNKRQESDCHYPIHNWDDEDLYTFVYEENIKLHPLYYNERGQFCVERRLGCIGCPLQGDRGKADYLQYPKFLKLLCQSYNKYGTTHKFMEGCYQDIVWQIFYSNHGEQKYAQTFHGLFDAPDPKEMLEEYFHIQL